MENKNILYSDYIGEFRIYAEKVNTFYGPSCLVYAEDECYQKRMYQVSTTEDKVKSVFDSVCEKCSEIRKEHFKSLVGIAEAFYTGGGIWLCGMHINENEYYTIDNECEDIDGEDYLNFFSHDGEDDDIDYPTQNLIWSKSVEELTDEEKAIYDYMRKELKKTMW